MKNNYTTFPEREITGTGGIRVRVPAQVWWPGDRSEETENGRQQ